jgi:hypothetical protein
MQVNIWGTMVIIAALAGAGLFVQNLRIESLKADLDTVTQTANTQAEQIKTLQQDFKGLQNIDKNRSERRQDQVKSDQKLDKDSKRADVVAKKPGLVENQINASFNKFAQSLQEATK